MTDAAGTNVVYEPRTGRWRLDWVEYMMTSQPNETDMNMSVKSKVVREWKMRSWKSRLSVFEGFLSKRKQPQPEEHDAEYVSGIHAARAMKDRRSKELVRLKIQQLLFDFSFLIVNLARNLYRRPVLGQNGLQTFQVFLGQNGLQTIPCCNFICFNVII